MKNKVGPPVEGNDFFGREKEFNYVWKLLQDENNLIFPSPRRVGKTSFALKHIAYAKANQWHTISVNMEKVTSETKFIELLIEQLKTLSNWEKIKDKGEKIIEGLKSLKPKLNLGSVELQLEWKEKKEDLYKEVFSLFNHNEKTLIFIDELTVLLHNIITKDETAGKQNATDFLELLRSIRQVPKSKIRWIFCSSVGIENFMLKHQLSFTMNDTMDYKLKSFTVEESHQMLTLLAKSNNLSLSDELITAIIAKLDYCQPYFLQIIFEKIKSLHSVEDIPIDQAIIPLAYESILTGKHFNTWIERLEEQYQNDQDMAFKILKHICQERKSKREQLLNALSGNTNESWENEKKLSDLLYMLSNDGYLTEESGFYQFQSPLLRDFWFKRFVK